MEIESQLLNMAQSSQQLSILRYASDDSSATEATPWQCLLLLPVFDTICSFLAPQDILALRRTARGFAALYPLLSSSQYNVNQLLRHFVRNPVALRCELAKHSAIISGDMALQFFDRVNWRESSLDIYVEDQEPEAGTAMSSLGGYLVDAEGYSRFPAKGSVSWMEKEDEDEESGSHRAQASRSL